MKIFCSDMTIFDRSEGDSYYQLRRVFLRAAQGQHAILLADVDHLLESDFFTQATAPMDRVEWQELVRKTALAADMNDPTVDPVTTPQSLHALLAKKRVPVDSLCRFSLTPRDAGHWAEQPLRILLENDRDWRLLEAAARAMNRPLVENAYLQGWLILDGRGGGGEVLNSVKARKANDRIFVFVDSDKSGPHSHASTTAKNIKDECDKAPSIPCRITLKREVENYIPQETLKATIYAQPKRARRQPREGRKSHLKAFSEWSKLDKEKRDYDDLGARFGKALTEEALENLKNPIICPAHGIIDLAGEELREVLDLIEEHL